MVNTREEIRNDEITIPVLLNDQEVTAVVDTGSTNTLLSTALATRLLGNNKPQDCTNHIKMGNSQIIKTTKVMPLSVKAANKKVDLMAIILPESSNDCLLGKDFLNKIGAKLSIDGVPIENLPITEHQPTAKWQIKDQQQTLIEEITTVDETAVNTQIKTFLGEEIQKFEKITGLTQLVEHHVVVRDNKPVKQRYMPRNPAIMKIINMEVNELIQKNCIEPSKSPHSSPIVLVKKKNNKWRLCIDFRQINEKSIPDAYPLPRIQSILDRIRPKNGKSLYISTLDLKNGYWQVPMAEDSKIYTAFTVPGRGLFQWKVMPFGLHSAPATFQRLLDTVIGPELENFAFAYLDDIIVFGHTIEEHTKNLKVVFERLRAANLKINAEKCNFFQREIKFLGHVISQNGIQTDPDKIAAIKELQPPKNIKELRSYMGLASWYRRFVPEFAKITDPLRELLKKGKHWRWGEPQQTAFETLKTRVTEAPVLACPDFNLPFTLQTDASNYGLGVILTQIQENVERVIAYASRRLNDAEKNYSATEKECLAIVWGIRKMRPYLEGYKFKVITDHLALKWLNSMENPTGRIARWALELQQHDFDVIYRKGKLNVVADTLSRQPLEVFRQLQVTENTDTQSKWLERLKIEIKSDPSKNQEYTIIGNNVYRNIPTENDEARWKLCVPQQMRHDVLKENHTSQTAGHLGYFKTRNRVAEKYYWPGMNKDIKKFVKQCDSCQRYKASQQPPAGEMLTKLAHEPWEIICADFVGPLPRSKHGNTMLLVFHDKFSKWVELIPMRSATSEGVQKAIRQSIIAKAGTPKVLITDNGRQFTCKKLQNFLKDVGIHQQFTAPYTPQENPTERSNRTIKTIIAQLSKSEQRTWDEFLPEIALAINTAVSESTGYTPAFLLYGKELRAPGAIFEQDVLGTGRPTVTTNERAEKREEIMKIVRNNLRLAAHKQAKTYNLRRRKWTPNIGDWVLAKQRPLSRKIDNFNSKLAPKYAGPFQIWNFVSPVIVTLKNKRNGKIKTAHISDLKSYHTEEKITQTI